jgi:hypothetical protein
MTTITVIDHGMSLSVLYPRTTKDWNALKDAIVGTQSLEAFKAFLRQ